TPAPRPSDTNITIWVRRLREGKTPADRARATREFITLNNPAALEALATAFATDPAPEVREAARQAGKELYQGLVYWQMEQDGTLKQLMAERARAAGKKLKG
ncbi:MAG TPA: hypothetical protein VJZ27_20140, partial [Aggregatilineales bacterium]|nr:hypothetical protein [Aggregatilineales bacterium]